MAGIELENVSLTYPLYEGGAYSFRRQFLKKFGWRGVGIDVRQVEALRDVSLRIDKGTRLGLVGRNGAGKSSFLRLLAGIYPATGGTLKINGSVSTLFDLSLGMDEDASGYENMYIAGAMLGFSSAEITGAISDIEEFTELGSALNRSLKTYSAGMRVRLAFALATMRNSDIILVDEIVGVGDTAFLRKARGRIREMMSSASIFCLASHAEFMLTDFCDRGLVFDSGQIVYDGPIDAAIKFYNENINAPA